MNRKQFWSILALLVVLSLALSACAQPTPTPVPPTVPEYLPGGLAQKFWDAEKKQVRVDALAKSYAHLESRLGAFKGAPPVGEDGKVRYELRLPEGVEGLDPKELAEDPFWQGIQEDFAAANVSQELADKLASRYFTTMAKQNMVNRESELMSLRRNQWSDAKLRQLGDFWAGQCETAEEFEDIQALCTTARGVLTLDRIRNRMLQTKLLPPEAAAGSASADELTVQYDRMLAELGGLAEGSPAFQAKRREVDAIRDRLIAARGGR